MKLEINLADREEIAAAVPLLQLILDGTTKPQSAAPLPPIVAPSIAAATVPPIAPEVPQASLTAPPAPSPPAFPVPVTAVQQVAPIAPAPGAAPSVELDSAGLPWDERIHSSAKTRNGNGAGTWKAKRNVDAALVSQVEAELRQQLAPPAHFNPPFTPVIPDASDAAAIFAGSPDPVAAFGGGAVAPAPLPIAPPAAPSVPAAPVAPSASADPTTFEQLMLRVSPAVASGTLPPQALQAACAGLGLPSIVALQQQPAMVSMVWATLKQQAPTLQ